MGLFWSLLAAKFNLGGMWALPGPQICHVWSCLTLQLSGLTCRLLPCDSWLGGHIMGQASLYLPPHSCLVQLKDFCPVTAGLGEKFYSYQL